MSFTKKNFPIKKKNLKMSQKIKKTLLFQYRCLCCHFSVDIYEGDGINKHSPFCSLECKQNYNVDKKIRKCWNCKNFKTNMKKCTKCKIPFYCSKECQSIDWKKQHKNECYDCKNPPKNVHDLDKVVKPKRVENSKSPKRVGNSKKPTLHQSKEQFQADETGDSILRKILFGSPADAGKYFQEIPELRNRP